MCAIQRWLVLKLGNRLTSCCSYQKDFWSVCMHKLDICTVHMHPPSTSLLRILALLITNFVFHDPCSEFICDSVLPTLVTVLQNWPNEREESANSCSLAEDCHEQTGISENAAETCFCNSFLTVPRSDVAAPLAAVNSPHPDCPGLWIAVSFSCNESAHRFAKCWEAYIESTLESC